MLRAGTTTIEAKSGYGLERKTELKMLRVLARLDAEGPARIVPTLLAAHTCSAGVCGRRAEYVRWIAEELIPEVAARGWRGSATPFATITPSRWRNRARC
jgi:imidazolonepropionase